MSVKTVASRQFNLLSSTACSDCQFKIKKILKLNRELATGSFLTFRFFYFVYYTLSELSTVYCQQTANSTFKVDRLSTGNFAYCRPSAISWLKLNRQLPSVSLLTIRSVFVHYTMWASCQPSAGCQFDFKKWILNRQLADDSFLFSFIIQPVRIVNYQPSAEV